MKKKNSIILFFFILGFCSCKKDHDPVVDPKVEVYVAGFIDSSSNKIYPTYWKNGSPVQLKFDYTIKQAWATSIAVSGNDIYVTGYRINWSPSRITTTGMFWKNDISIEQDDYSTQITSLVVSNNDVYMVAAENLWYGQIAKYWKNGSLVNLIDGSQGSTASAIIVAGNDVYVAGTGITGIEGSNGIGIAKYWKNGKSVNLTDGSKNANALSIAVSGSDVYLAGIGFEGLSINGTPNGIAKYWKNGTPINLTDGSKDAAANSIAVSGDDVYVAGNEGNVAKYWKNGSPVNLTDGSTYSVANSITISGNDVYVAGEINDRAHFGRMVSL